jgi:transposase
VARRLEVIGVQALYMLSDALWARVAAILATVDPAPPANARALVDAIIFRALAGCTWDELPSAYPPPSDVAACAERWRELGFQKRLEPVLLFRLS